MAGVAYGPSVQTVCRLDASFGGPLVSTLWRQWLRQRVVAGVSGVCAAQWAVVGCGSAGHLAGPGRTHRAAEVPAPMGSGAAPWTGACAGHSCRLRTPAAGRLCCGPHAYAAFETCSTWAGPCAGPCQRRLPPVAAARGQGAETWGRPTAIWPNPGPTASQSNARSQADQGWPVHPWASPVD